MAQRPALLFPVYSHYAVIAFGTPIVTVGNVRRAIGSAMLGRTEALALARNLPGSGAVGALERQPVAIAPVLGECGQWTFATTVRAKLDLCHASKSSGGYDNSDQDQLSLAAFLDECPNEVFCVAFQDVVNFVENGVDVLGQFLVALAEVGRGLLGLLDLVLTLALWPVLLVGRHLRVPFRSDPLTLARTGAGLASARGVLRCCSCPTRTAASRREQLCGQPTNAGVERNPPVGTTA